MIMCKKKSRSKILDNRKKGIIGEQIIKQLYKDRGSRIIPSKQGSDFIAINNITGTRKKYREYVEVKTGFSKQTKRQKITMKKVIQLGYNYTVLHISDAFLKKYLLNNEDFLK